MSTKSQANRPDGQHSTATSLATQVQDKVRPDLTCCSSALPWQQLPGWITPQVPCESKGNSRDCRCVPCAASQAFRDSTLSVTVCVIWRVTSAAADAQVLLTKAQLVSRCCSGTCSRMRASSTCGRRSKMLVWSASCSASPDHNRHQQHQQHSSPVLAEHTLSACEQPFMLLS